MSISQTKFLGASISNFSASVGWNNQESTLTVYLVEDFSNTTSKKYYSDYSDYSLTVYDDYFLTNEPDLFFPPKLGNPVHFRFENFVFNGLLQSWTKERSTNGSYVYSVTLVDPRSILEATDVILNSFDEAITSSVSNLLNVYGYYEAVRFGNSLVNEAGMPWYKIKEAITVLTSGPINVYGLPLKYRGFSYGVIFDLASFPTLPDYYRVNGQPSINLLDMITQVCADASNDFVVKLRLIDGGFYIVIDCVSRYLQQIPGKIDDFINSIDNGTILNKRSGGLELRKEVTSSYLVGGNIEAHVEVTNGTLNNSDELKEQINIASNQCIWPYWGLDNNGEVILGTDLDVEHSFEIDISLLSFNTLPTSSRYVIDVGEILSARAGFQNWIDYVSAKKPELKDVLNLPTIINFNAVINNAMANGQIIKPALLKLTPKQAQDAAVVANRLTQLNDDISRLFETVSSYIPMYGQYFMVRLPDENNVSIIKGKYEPETLKLLLNYDVTDGGWIDSDIAPLGAPAFYSEIFKSNNGKYECFVRFDISEGYVYDFSHIQSGDVIFRTTDDILTEAWVRAEAQQIVFLNNANLLDGRVVIKLSGPVYLTSDLPQNYAGLALLLGISKGKEEGIKNARGNHKKLEITDTELQSLSATAAAEPGERTFMGLGATAIMPSAAAIPLRSNTNFYGPWISYGPQGKTIFEQDSNLVPWNYNGIAAMNLVGQTFADSRVSKQQTVETGEITIIGSPELEVGEALMLNGPTVTDINVNIGLDGITTTYRMRTYTPEFGRLAKSFTDRFTRLRGAQTDMEAKLTNKIKGIADTQQTSLPKKSLASFSTKKGTGDNIVAGRGDAALGGRRGAKHSDANSPHGYIVAANIPTNTNKTLFRSSVGMQTLEESQLAFQSYTDQFRTTAAAGLDSLFRPFSTSYAASGIPHYETPTSLSSEIDVRDLNPIGFGNIGNVTPSSDFTFILNGAEANEYYAPELEDFNANNARMVGLRMPMIGVGWGYDTDGKPVPNATGVGGTTTDDFLSNYRLRSDQWKAGPIDIRWHNEKKCWVAGAGDPEKMGVVIQHYGTVDSHPAYVVREPISYNSGTIVYYTHNDIPALSGANDHIVFNIQEIGLSKHTIGVGSAVTLKRFNGQYYINEHVRTLIKRS